MLTAASVVSPVLGTRPLLFMILVLLSLAAVWLTGRR